MSLISLWRNSKRRGTTPGAAPAFWGGAEGFGEAVCRACGSSPTWAWRNDTVIVDTAA
jgi:hypothetical protein